jgi:hypothetical protein
LEVQQQKTDSTKKDKKFAELHECFITISHVPRIGRRLANVFLKKISLSPSSRIFRQWPLSFLPLDLRDVHGPHRERLPHLLQQLAATEQQMRERVR